MKALNIDSTQPVLVTGATGYLAGWIVKRLLEAGCEVRAPVRDPADAEKLKSLNAIAEAAPGSIQYFKADLMELGSYNTAMEGCRTVFHTASPFKLQVQDPQRQLIDPALMGTKNVLEAASASGSVQRVVLTSSCAAIYTDALDCVAAPNGCLTEAIWNSTASLDYQPYAYSKTVAEQAAWQLAKAQDSWDLVTINPALVMGPAIGGQPSSESFSIMQQVGAGAFKTGAPRLGMGVVDVRDVAEAHMAAAFIPEAQGRYITVAHNSDIFAMLNTLQERFGRDYGIPKRAAPKWLIWIMAPMFGITRKYVARNVNYAWRADNSKSIAGLGMAYRPLQQTMEDMFQYMIDVGYFKKR